MSRTLSAPRWGLSAVLAGALALVLTALAARWPGFAGERRISPQANAQGENIIGRGASFARDAHKVFNDKFKLVYCVGTPGAGKINVTYEAAGSGAGRQSVKVRDGADPRFGMTDEPPVPSEINEMNSGVEVKEGKNFVDSDPSNDGKIHVVPAAVGAVAPLVNFPDACDVGLLDSASRTAEEMSGEGHHSRWVSCGFALRRKSSRRSGPRKRRPTINWVEVFPELNTDADCNKPIIRVVRFDDSGTSFAFKDYLNTINEARGWISTFAATEPKKTREWPGADFRARERPKCAGVSRSARVPIAPKQPTSQTN